MKQNFYNVIKFKKAISFIKKDPWTAKMLLENYIDEYPLDYNGMAYYIFVLITLNKIDEAINYMSNLEDESKRSLQFKLTGKSEILKRYLLLNKIKILAVQERYLELYNLINNSMSLLEDINHSLRLMCEYKLGLINKEGLDISSLSYVEKQIVDYEEEALINHVKRHLSDDNQDIQIPSSSIFSVDFKLEKVMKEVKKYIPSDKKIISTPISDFYIFKYNDCGRDNGTITDFFKVVCFHNSDKIITLFPISGVDNIESVDLNYLVETKHTGGISQIEKFNRRLRKSKV